MRRCPKDSGAVVSEEKLCGLTEGRDLPHGGDGGDSWSGTADALFPGMGEHFAHQHAGDAQKAQQNGGRKAEIAAVGGHGHHKESGSAQNFHTLSVLFHREHLQKNKRLFDFFDNSIARMFEKCKHLFGCFLHKFSLRLWWKTDKTLGKHGCFGKGMETGKKLW